MEILCQLWFGFPIHNVICQNFYCCVFRGTSHIPVCLFMVRFIICCPFFRNDISCLSSAYMGITCSPFPKNDGNLSLSFFGVNYPVIPLYNIYQGLYIYINWFTWIIIFIVVNVIQNIRGNDNSPNSLNLMLNCHYHS